MVDAHHSIAVVLSMFYLWDCDVTCMPGYSHGPEHRRPADDIWHQRDGVCESFQKRPPDVCLQTRLLCGETFNVIRGENNPNETSLYGLFESV